MENKLYVSMSPHIHGGDSISRKMWDVIIALIPALLVSLYFFGLGSLLVTSVSIASCVLFEYLIARFLLKQESTLRDGSAILTGLLLAFNLPSNLPLWIVVIGALVAIGMAKMSFGGLGNNIFNPALVGRVFLLISFPQQMTSWPLPKPFNLHYLDAATGATPLSVMKSSRFDRLPDMLDMFIGNTGGSLGEVAAAALILGGLFLLIRKVITWHIPVSILLTVYIFTGILRVANPEVYADPLSHLLTGGLMLGAIFMATDYVTSPMVKKGQVIYGIGIGIITVCIRVFGSYPEGVSFAILMMNGVTPLINAYCKPKRFGEVKKK
ncbi:MAG: RnfABCDGE type electron transport complex subunit D [Bacteroidales bacterium]|jgi:electron transport complex protein RnfD|nr:RnfABCDGE type electron transport complex subunit D [Bacteroidales bacterium]MDI9545064.1 RnfABCDGE type electron transport complex subunit D [Bacteroidota bacterium]OQC02413.1 MAG: Electron transport complex protein RnfD [Bacteroidetes bacterium ADurb.Bin090]MBP8982722.1 RnfABCDGE type electron transport complex subunit D [Bacteroidales bacterium]NLV38827.1 RnfABCDGE type electron transport complex subunit D [Bacteroidales bacterium]